jgi:hypothetical protein
MIEQFEQEIISEDGGIIGTKIPLTDLLDRFEILFPDNINVKYIRRSFNDQDLYSIFKLCDNEDLRKAVMDENIHSLFRILDNYSTQGFDHDDLRKAAIDKNLHSLFRVFLSLTDDQEFIEDLRKTTLDKNLHSLFRVFLSLTDDQEFIEDLRKTTLDKNLHSLFRVLTGLSSTTAIDEEILNDLRKCMLDKNLHSLFRVLTGLSSTTAIDEEILNDLRKCMLDQNLYSIFRSVVNYQEINNPENVDLIEEFRKSVLNQNLKSIVKLYTDIDLVWKAMFKKDVKSIFELSDNEDLKKLVLYENRFSVYRLLENEIDTQLLTAIKRLEEENITFATDCLSRGQLQSKMWLIDIVKGLDLDLGCVFLCAGWYGTLATMMFENGIKIDKIRNFDTDSEAVKISEIFNKPWVSKNWMFKSSVKDIHEINYKVQEYQVTKFNGETETLWDTPDTVINTSCEHIHDFDYWYHKLPTGILLILQTNDFEDISDHVNCSRRLEDFEAQTPMTECLFSGELNVGKYTRFMRIGYK